MRTRNTGSAASKQVLFLMMKLLKYTFFFNKNVVFYNPNKCIDCNIGVNIGKY